ncbi:hypothetical protein PIB30_060346 [Stylosanthes scabra]|uniref:Uncharacterized protein n=1 Tax=Stylosanthes scabra TaxID=79078 RepID=A0ABU6ZJ93_9FABA|nr:hypothetical protein [Stylosanthes scabra]
MAEEAPQEEEEEEAPQEEEEALQEEQESVVEEVQQMINPSSSQLPKQQTGSFSRFLEVFACLDVNLPLLHKLKEMPTHNLPPKKKDMGKTKSCMMIQHEKFLHNREPSDKPADKLLQHKKPPDKLPVTTRLYKQKKEPPDKQKHSKAAQWTYRMKHVLPIEASFKFYDPP